MTRILFVCHGNICRSPMAEFVMKDLVRKAGLEAQFHIESAATSTEEIGNPVYPPARRKLAEHSIDCTGKTARQLIRADYDRFDLLIGMDRANLRDMGHVCGGDPDGKQCLLMDCTDRRKGAPAKPSFRLCGERRRKGASAAFAAGGSGAQRTLRQRAGAGGPAGDLTEKESGHHGKMAVCDVHRKDQDL